MSDALPATSYMKAPRAHYRMRGGKFWGALLLLLFATLIALVFKADTYFFGTVSPQRTVILVLLDLGLMLVLMAYVVQHRARLLWTRAHDGMLGTRLQSRIIFMFSGIAIMPTLVVATFSILFFNVGIKSWFDNAGFGAVARKFRSVVATGLSSRSIRVPSATTRESMGHGTARQGGA